MAEISSCIFCEGKIIFMKLILWVLYKKNKTYRYE